jgi:hypothetical protein
MSIKASILILFTFLVFAPVACSFKKDSAKAPSDAVLYPAGKDVPSASKDRPNIFETIAKKDDALSISVIDQYSVAEVDSLKQSGDSVLDAVLKTQSTTLLRYLIGRGVSPVNFGFQSLEWVDGGYVIYADLIPYLYEYFGKIASAKATFDSLHFSEASCVYYIQLEFRTLAVNEQTGTDSSDGFLESAKLFTNSKNCRDSMNQVPRENLGVWFQDEFYRQSHFGFSNIGVLRFLDLVSVDRRVEFAVTEPFFGGYYERDPRTALFLSPLTDYAWTEFMDAWWPLIGRHSKANKLGPSGGFNEPESEGVPVPEDRKYQGYFISEEALGLCKNDRLDSLCEEFKKTFKLEKSHE